MAVDVDSLQSILSDSKIPWDIEIRKSVDSTNTELTNVFAEVSSSPYLLLWAEEQRKGRGRLSRSWLSVPDLDITASVIFPSPVEAIEVPKLSLCAGLALVEVLQDLGIESTVRWPNDVVTPNGKIAGILSTYLSIPDAVICGIGINVNSDPDTIDLPPDSKRTTIYTESGKQVPREFVFGHWLLTFMELWRYASADLSLSLADRFDRRSFYHGKRIRVLEGAQSGLDEIEVGEGFEGIAMSIDPSGALLVLKDDGLEYPVSIDDVLIPVDI